jgi:dTMP kinase
LRALLLHGGEAGLDPTVEALLMVADRAEHVRRVLRPALAEGRLVLCDRHADATLAYQGGGSGLDRARLREWNRAATGDLTPDLTVLLDLPPELAHRRLSQRPGAPARDRFESESPAFFERVRAVYLELAAAEPERWLVLDATWPADNLTEAIEGEVVRRLPKNLTPGGVGSPGSPGALC